MISFKIGDVVAATTNEGMQLGLITDGDPNNNKIIIEWTDGKTITHNINDTIKYRSFYLSKKADA